ncbi:MAG TPA: tRNA preQ1(34) S-adenosylmethionine ribosyltransferase-isomerase QueA, partial [Rhodospirillaceae bacterium]|nr:tRNA preQ1(34) S-adenosylmethionine ribosyltransferase-isomerase QueA [Rhodospirillaceae bacterium]
MTDTFTLDDFDFELPTTRIAQEPARPRDSARLLEIGDGLSDRTILDLPEMLAPGDVLVLNNTKVIPARLHGKRGNARIEATLNKQIEGNRWRVFARPGRRLRISDEVKFGKDFSARVHEKLPNGEVVLDFETRDFAAALTANGAMPLPPYIERLPTPT